MITIRCTQLEQVRRNPAAYAQILAGNDTINNGGTYGMFAYMKDAAKTVHIKEKSVSEAMQDLQNKFIRFSDTPSNRTKQEKLLEQFTVYNKSFIDQGFELIDGSRNMKWNITPEARLTGRTPWVVENESGELFSYFIIEKTFDWQSELRFPLYQQYLSENTMKCNLSDIKIGVYNLSTAAFDFTSYSPKTVKKTIEETTGLFENVNIEYLKRKK